MSFLVFTAVFLLVAAVFSAVALYARNYKPKQITYLSPEALNEKHIEIESIRLEALNKAYTQVDIDCANEDCDALYELYKLRR